MQSYKNVFWRSLKYGNNFLFRFSGFNFVYLPEKVFFVQPESKVKFNSARFVQTSSEELWQISVPDESVKVMLEKTAWSSSGQVVLVVSAVTDSEKAYQIIILAIS